MLVGQIKTKWYYQGEKTSCVISEGETIIADASIYRFHTDVPNKKYARAKAFKRAMQKIAIKNKLPKEVRATIWNTFRESINQPLIPVN